MTIIGINTSHNATACLLRDGKILACVSEERLSRIKNQSGMPYLAIRECLRICNLTLKDIDFLALNYKDPKIHTGYSAFEGEKGKIVKNQNFNLNQKILSLLWFAKEQILMSVPGIKYPLDSIVNIFYRFFIDPGLKKKLLDEIEQRIGILKSKVLFANHHDSHIYSAYFGSSFDKSKKILIFTLDSMGDGVCATVSTALGGQIKKIAVTPSGSSVGDLYTQTTAYLGMKLGEHEYKVMGLAPYASKKNYQRVYDKIKDAVWVNKDLTFGTKIHSHLFYKILPELYAYERFDNIAGSLQLITEEVICKWIKNGIEKTGISTVICAGGVFMNVKVNQKILELPDVKKLYIVPSASDESTAIGAAYWAHFQRNGGVNIDNIQDLYLGGAFDDNYIERVLNRKEYNDFKKEKPKELEKKVAGILANSGIVARFDGRMEFGARALGNRSILAHPSKLEVISQINDQIKCRDFWMPFAPSILEEDKKSYFLNRKNIEAPYMIITFNSTKEGKDKLRAATHQYDHTLRPQIVFQKWNPRYYKLIKEFKSITGIGAILNTSFNLHGYPIVYTPEDALYVFKNSGLEYMSLGSYLVTKR